MKTVRAALLSVSFLALASACGDDGVKAADYEGLWLINSITMAGEVAPMTLTRGGAPTSIRGDVLFTATGDASATLDARQIVLADGLPTGEPTSTDLTVAVEDGRWVLSETGGVTVFTVMKHDGGELMLTRDDADPRTTTTDSPLEIMLMPATPWTTGCVGPWDLVSMTRAAGVTTANACTEVVPGQRWAKVQMLVTFDHRLLFRRTMTMAGYSDAACLNMVSMSSSLQVGLGEEESSTSLRMWAVEGDSAEHLAFTIATAGDVMTLTRTACLPMPGCQADAPTTVVVKRR